MAFTSDTSEILLDQVVDRLVEALHPRAIYLFGSYARGDAGADSDLDFFVVVDDEAGETHDIAVRGHRALSEMPLPKDIVVYHHSDMEKWASVRSSLPYTVLKEGQLLYAA